MKIMSKDFFTFFIQKTLLYIFGFIFSLCFKYRKRNGTVVGLEEIASYLHNISSAINNSCSVAVKVNKFYSFEYDYDISKYMSIPFVRRVFPPIFLAYLSNKYKRFIYISARGFLLHSFDGREFEFKYLKSKNCEIICFFTGSDIRSYERMSDLSKKIDYDVYTDYQKYCVPGIKKSEGVRKKISEAADKYANFIFNYQYDQASYITRFCHPVLYFANDCNIRFDKEKYSDDQAVRVVVHAPSSPVEKGTQLVRAAVKALKMEGYNFEYRELIGVSNEVVLNNLKEAHIVLNQFYAFVPSVFGVEAMMNNAALLTSADKNIEKGLQGNANDAWIVTPYWRVYENLKDCLDMPMTDLKEQADAGTRWVKEWASYSSSVHYINELLGNDS